MIIETNSTISWVMKFPKTVNTTNSKECFFIKQHLTMYLINSSFLCSTSRGLPRRRHGRRWLWLWWEINQSIEVKPESINEFLLQLASRVTKQSRNSPRNVCKSNQSVFIWMSNRIVGDVSSKSLKWVWICYLRSEERFIRDLIFSHKDWSRWSSLSNILSSFNCCWFPWAPVYVQWLLFIIRFAFNLGMSLETLLTRIDSIFKDHQIPRTFPRMVNLNRNA